MFAFLAPLSAPLGKPSAANPQVALFVVKEINKTPIIPRC
jgi:hypothetical protein